MEICPAYGGDFLGQVEEGIYIFTSDTPNEHSIVWLKDNQAAQNKWPPRLITSVFLSEDKQVRKAKIKISRKDGTKHLLRPMTETKLELNTAPAITTFLAVVTSTTYIRTVASLMDPGEPCILTHGLLLYGDFFLFSWA